MTGAEFAKQLESDRIRTSALRKYGGSKAARREFSDFLVAAAVYSRSPLFKKKQFDTLELFKAYGSDWPDKIGRWLEVLNDIMGSSPILTP